MQQRKLHLPGIIFPVMFVLNSLVFAQGSPNVGREYALLGVQSGTSIIDITDAANAYEVEFFPSTFSLWKDIKTYQHYAYAVNENGMGLQIIDLSNLPNSATLVTTFTGFSSMHNIYIDEDNAILYASPGIGSDPAIAYSLADPVNPAQISTFGIHNHDAFARNNIVYLSEGWDGSFAIYDLSTPSSPSLLVRYTIPSAGYVHNAWLTDDGNYLMTTEETPGKTIKLWDIQNLSNITLKSEYLGPNGLAHNTHIKGNYAYLSHYGSGLRIVDISNPESIFEEGYYNTSDAWGAWPFFNSGKVLISDITDGLYIVYFAGAVVIPTGIEEEPEAPQNFSVSRNYPNPFNPSTTIEYQLSKASPVRLTIYNSLGQKVRTLVNDFRQPGSYQAVWDGRDDAGNMRGSGVYLYRFQASAPSGEAGNFSKTQKMFFIK
jgi:choice-of-anchor B domain-containing protein